MTMDQLIATVAEALSRFVIVWEDRNGTTWARIPDDEPIRLAKKVIEALNLTEEREGSAMSDKEYIRWVTKWTEAEVGPTVWSEKPTAVEDPD